MFVLTALVLIYSIFFPDNGDNTASGCVQTPHLCEDNPKSCGIVDLLNICIPAYTWSSLHRLLRSSIRSRLAGDSWMSCGPKVEANWFICDTSSLIGAISSWNSCPTHTRCYRPVFVVVRRQMGTTDRLLVGSVSFLTS